MVTNVIDSNMVRLRDISSAFSRSAFTDVLQFNDFSHFNWLESEYPTDSINYSDLLKRVYFAMSKDYRCEYVYKNELIKLLLRKYGTNKTVYFSEFRVGNSIADMVMFNGESKAFEIKTEYDSPRRLTKQMSDYKQFFDKCFLVIPMSQYEYYQANIEPTTGIIVLERNKGIVSMREIRPAIQNPNFTPEIMMSFLRKEEYQNIVESLGYDLSNVAGFDMFNFCREKILLTEEYQLKKLFLKEVKKRRNNTRFLRKYPFQLRQMMLSLNLSSSKAEILLNKLNTNIAKL